MKNSSRLAAALVLLALPLGPAAAQSSDSHQGHAAQASHGTQASHAAHAAHGARASAEDVAAITAVVEQLFDGMRAGDSTMVRGVFHPDVRMITTFRDREGRPQVRTEASADGFVQAVGTAHEEVWDERIWDLVIMSDADLGLAWMNYGFFLGDRFSHCGVNLMELVRTEQGWKIIHLADTRRREGCEVPAQ